MKIEWKSLREQLQKSSNTPKYHDSVHAEDRITLFGPPRGSGTRSFEKSHHKNVKKSYLTSNKRDTDQQLSKKVKSILI